MTCGLLRTVGVRHVVFAGAVRDGDELRGLQLASAMPLRVVRLEVPLEEIAAIAVRPDDGATR